MAVRTDPSLRRVSAADPAADLHFTPEFELLEARLKREGQAGPAERRATSASDSGPEGRRLGGKLSGRATAVRARPASLAAVAALGVFMLAMAALVPSGAPGGREILQRAAAALSPEQASIMVATTSTVAVTNGERIDTGSARVWVHRGPDGQTVAMRWLKLDASADQTAAAGAEEVSTRLSDGTGVVDSYSPITGKTTRTVGMQAVPGAIFNAEDAVRRALSGDAAIAVVGEPVVDGRATYQLRWADERPDSANRIVFTLWVDRETYEPVRFSDRSSGIDARGNRFEQSLTQTVTGFERLADTPENRRLLKMSAAGAGARSTRKP